MSNTKDIVAGILVGGKSSRMGQNKAHLPFGQTTLAERIQETLARCGIQDYYYIGNTDLSPKIEDKVVHGGPVWGLYAFFESVLQKDSEGKAALILPVDMPFLDVELLSNLFNAHTSQATYYQESPLPFVVELSESVFETLKQFVFHHRNKHCSLLSFHNILDSQRLSLPSEMVWKLQNINTQSDYDRALKLAGTNAFDECGHGSA